LPTILVADDNSNIQKMVTLAFKSEGIDVVAVGNGEACVRKAAEIIPDLVLADIFMPVRNGYEVCEFLKQDSRYSHIPVVLLAGAFDPFDEREAQRVGADGVLKKPFVPPDPLVALVKELLAKTSEGLVTVSVPAQSTPGSTRNSPQAAESSATSNSVAQASSSNASVAEMIDPPVSVHPPVSRLQELAEDETGERTIIAPIRDFAIPSDSGHDGGADAFGSMMETNPLETETPVAHADDEVERVADREVQPVTSHSVFEGLSTWLGGAPNAIISEEDESTEQPNQFMPSTKDLMGRVWELDPSLAKQSPDETVIEPRAEVSPLTHSIPHVTNARNVSDTIIENTDLSSVDDADIVVESDSTVEPENAVETEPTSDSRVSDWRSAFTQVHEQTAQVIDSSSASTSSWRQFSSHIAPVHGNHTSETSSAAELEPAVEPEQAARAQSLDAPNCSNVLDAAAQSGAPELAEPAAEQLDSQSATDGAAHAEVKTHEEPRVQSEATGETGGPATTDWNAPVPQHLSPADTTTIARSLVEELAPAAVESATTSFPVPTGMSADPRVVEDIVARVVERMQPQILEIITREVLRPVVEALVRRQLEQKLPE
jgi:CheY-like chemotaxis protein